MAFYSYQQIEDLWVKRSHQVRRRLNGIYVERGPNDAAMPSFELYRHKRDDAPLLTIYSNDHVRIHADKCLNAQSLAWYRKAAGLVVYRHRKIPFVYSNRSCRSVGSAEESKEYWNGRTPCLAIGDAVLDLRDGSVVEGYIFSKISADEQRKAWKTKVKEFHRILRALKALGGMEQLGLTPVPADFPVTEEGYPLCDEYSATPEQVYAWISAGDVVVASEHAVIMWKARQYTWRNIRLEGGQWAAHATGSRFVVSPQEYAPSAPHISQMVLGTYQQNRDAVRRLAGAVEWKPIWIGRGSAPTLTPSKELEPA